jgi:N-acetylmuramoyl-L-alanine amidase
MCTLCMPSQQYGRRDAIRLAGGAAAVLAFGRVARAPLPAPVEVTSGLSIYPRIAWADGMPQLWAPGPEDVRFLLVHHTASGNRYSENEAIDTMRSAYRFHTGPDKSWPDVCYNFFVDRFGRVFEGRDGSLAGSVLADATGGNQGFAQLVCLIGDFTDELPTAAAVDSLQRTLSWLADRHGVDTSAGSSITFESRGSNRWSVGEQVQASTISGHRDMSSTACPGDAFYPYVHEQLQADVHLLRNSVVIATPATVTSPAVTGSAAPAPTTSAAPASSAPTTSTVPTTSTAPTPSSPSAAPNATEAPRLNDVPVNSVANTELPVAMAAGTDGSPAEGRSGSIAAVAGGALLLAAAAGGVVRHRTRGVEDAADEPR